jgi:hypothetical protein
MIKKTIFFIPVFILLIALSISACGKESTPVESTNNGGESALTVFTYEEKELREGFSLGEPDQSFISGEPCGAPCFYNIELLTTSGDEAKDILGNLSFINPASIIEEDNVYDEDSYYIKYSCSEDLTELCGYIGVSSYQMVTGMGHKVFYRLSLADVVDKYGTPDFSYKNAAYSGTDQCEIVVYYVDQNFAVEIIEDGDTGLCQDFGDTETLNGDLQIDWVYYNFINEEIAANMIEWQGLK